MAQTFIINSTTLSYITAGDWDDTPDNQALDGVTAMLRLRRHILKAQAMPESEFDTLTGLLGTQVSLTTTDYIDRNGAYKTYYGCNFDDLRGRHSGPNMVDVIAEFGIIV